MPAERVTELHMAVERVKAERKMRDGWPCNYPACGCEWDAVCDDAIAKADAAERKRNPGKPAK